MIGTICFVGDCKKVIERLDKVTTSRIKRKCQNGKLIIEKRGKELEKIKKEEPGLSFKKIQEKYKILSINILEVKDLEKACKARQKNGISPEKFLVVIMKDKDKKTEKNKFYSFLEEYGWLVSLPDSSEKYIQELIATFFLNFKEEKNRKLKDLL